MGSEDDQVAGPRKLYQQVAAAMAEAIRRGEYAPGRRLPSERELAEIFNVSRPTLREATIALEIQGYVESRQGSGIYVTPRPPVPGEGPDLDIGPFELTEARRVVESETCALAAISILDEEVEELERLLVDMADQAEAPTPDGGALDEETADRRFHVLIAQATRNSALVGVVESLWDTRYRSPLCREMLARARRAGDRPRIDEHRAIVNALAARDPQAARLAMRDHLTRVIDGLLAATENEAVQRARQETVERRVRLSRRAAI